MFGIVEAFERIITAGAIETNTGGFFKQTAAIIGFEGERSIYKTLTEDGICPFAQACLGE